MNIIFIGRKHSKSKTLQFGDKQFALLFFLLFLIIWALMFLGYELNNFLSDKNETSLSKEIVAKWKLQIDNQGKDVIQLKKLAKEKVDALTLRMGDMQARLLRLDALGERLTEVAKLGNGEFDFTTPPALGGPDNVQLSEAYVLPELNESLNKLEQQISNREQQLDVIDALFVSRTTQKELFIAGRPIKRGWLSSSYGYRTDPFTGKRAWHGGVDFAGKENSDVVAVASGVVTYSGDRYGYGNLVEINHGGGYTTRYAHCKTIFVSVGDVVKKGHVIAAMGSTGRSTGPHVHYEVRRDGIGINPKKYIFRNKS